MLFESEYAYKYADVTLETLQCIYVVENEKLSFPVAQMVEHGASNAKIMGSIPRESKSW